MSRKVRRLSLHCRALANWLQGYAWSCVKRDRETGHTA